MAKTDDTIIAGLLRERDGYLRTGRADRAKLVEEQLELRGYDLEGEAKAEASPAKEEPKGRTTQPRRTTAESGKK